MRTITRRVGWGRRQECGFGYIKCEIPVVSLSWAVKYTIESRVQRDRQTENVHLGVISDREQLRTTRVDKTM